MSPGRARRHPWVDAATAGATYTPPAATSLDDAIHLIRVVMIADEEVVLATRALLPDAAEPEYVLDSAPTVDDGLAAIARAQHDVFIISDALDRRAGGSLLRAAVAHDSVRLSY